MLTIYWFRDGVRVARGEHPFSSPSDGSEVVQKEFASLDDALKQIKKTNRAYGTLVYMKEQDELAQVHA